MLFLVEKFVCIKLDIENIPERMHTPIAYALSKLQITAAKNNFIGSCRVFQKFVKLHFLTCLEFQGMLIAKYFIY